MQLYATSNRWVSHLGQVVLLAAIYFGAAKLSLLLAIPPGYATAVWPPSGIAMAAMLLLGRRIWPGIWLGAALVNLTVNSSYLAAVLIGCGNTLEAVAGSALILRYIGKPGRFDSGEDVVKFVACAAISATVAATIAVVSLMLQGAVSGQNFFQNWWTWWQGDTTGIIILTPLILSWSVRDSAAWSRKKMGEAACCGLLLLLATAFSFDNANWASLPVRTTFLILPIIIWVALRFSQREVATATTAISALAIGYTLQGLGPFAVASLNESLLLQLAFTSTIVATGLVLSAVVGQRGRAMHELELALQDLEQQAITDALTNLHNRRYLREHLPRELSKAKRRSATLALIMIDLDYFKRINDGFGHEAGDIVLTEVAASFKTHIRDGDIACRYGGEEFVLVLPDSTLEGARSRAEAIRLAVKRLKIEYRGQRIEDLSVSLGVALFPHHAEDPDALIRAADEALYVAKSDGRDRVAVVRLAMKSLLGSMQTRPL